MRIERYADWRRPLLLLILLPFLTSAQSGYDFETQPIRQEPFSPRGYQPPPQPARYPVPAPAPRFLPHQSVGYQPPPQPAQYPQHYAQPHRPVYRPLQIPAPAQVPQRPAFHHPQPAYEVAPDQYEARPAPHRPSPAYEQERYRGPHPDTHRPALVYEMPHSPAPSRYEEPAPPPSYEALPIIPAAPYDVITQRPVTRPAPQRPASQPPKRPAPGPEPAFRPSPPVHHPEPSRPSPYEPDPETQSTRPYRPASPRPAPARPSPYAPEAQNPYEPAQQRPVSQPSRSPAPAPAPRPAPRPAPSPRPSPYEPESVEHNPYEQAPEQQRPVQRPGQTRQPPAIAPAGTFRPAPGAQNPEGLNVMIHVFINEKQKEGEPTAATGPTAPPATLPPELAGIHFPHSSMPLTFTRDFDRTKNRFLMEDEDEEGPANIVEIKAVVDSSDAAMDMRIGKAMAKELDRAVPAILGKLRDKTARLDEDLRNQLEQELISEISKNLGGHLEDAGDVTEKELSELIDQGFKELETEDETVPPSTATRPTAAARPATHSSPATTQPARPPAPQTTAPTVRPPHAPTAATEPSRPTAPSATSIPTQPAQTPGTTAPARPPATSAAPAPASRAPAPPGSSTAAAATPPAPATEAPAAPATEASTVQWWTPTTASPEATRPIVAAVPPATTASPLPPVATMRTFPTETLPPAVTQPTLKEPELSEEKSQEVDESPFHHQGEEFPTEQPNDTMKTMEEEKGPATSECSVPRDLTDTTKADVLFLLDSSNSFDEHKFKGALELIANTTEHFKNIGPDGVQVSLVQFSSEPQLEFSLRRHNCLPTLIEDIKGTEYMKGKSMLGNAIDKATRLAFTRERGDRPEIENLLIVVTDGATEDKVQQPVSVAKQNGVDVLVISTIEANPDVVMELAGSSDNIFKMDGKVNPLSARLAERIRQTASGYRIPEQRFPIFHESKDESAEEKKKEEEGDKGGEKPKDSETATTDKSTTLMSGEVTQESLPPPRNLKLACTRKSMGINIELPGAFHGWLFIEGQREKENCSMKVEKDEKEYRLVHFEAGIEECDIAHIQSEKPVGINSSAVVSIVKHPKAVSIDDKAYLLECFVASSIETTLDAHLEVVGGIKKTIAEAFSLDVVPPKCHYTIRKGSPEGPEVEKADLGEVVYHRWDCDGGDEAYDVFGMHIHDCYASSDVEQQFPILDKNGCSSNTNLLSAPVYAEGALSVYAESRAFAVENDQQDLKFQCKVSLCTRDGDGCEGITPPHCTGNDTDLLVSRRLRHNQAVDSALTSAVATSVGLTTASISKYSPTLVIAMALILVTVAGLISAVRLKSCRSRRSSSRPIVTSPSMEEIYVTVPGRAPIRSSAPNPAMTNFMKDFDRSRYV